jgi:mRNA-degrading endonuclease HigB of HigAB toxin-antitoxin module
MLTARKVAKERGLTSGYRVVINNGEQVLNKKILAEISGRDYSIIQVLSFSPSKILINWTFGPKNPAKT